jgi:flagellin FlaB
VPRTLTYWEVRGVKKTLIQRLILFEKNASIGIGSLIVFIAMILVAGIAASVIIQTMNSLEQQSLQTGQEAMRDVSSGLKVTQVSGYNNGSTISQIAIFIKTTAGSDSIDLIHTHITLSDTSKIVILNLNTSIFSNSVSGGLFGTLDDTNINSTTYGLMVVRDIDNSCTSSNPNINSDDLVILLVNSSACFSGIGTRTEVTGNIVPEYGISGVISFTSPSAYINTIIELQT